MNDDLLATFRKVVGLENGIKLLNTYKGLPISYEATVTELTPTSIVVTTSKYQVVCLYVERETLVQSHHLRSPVRATVMQLSAAQTAARLANLQPLKSLGERSQIRVQPGEPTPVVIQVRPSRNEVHTELANISQNGMAVYLSRSLFLPRTYVPGADLNVLLSLPGISLPTGGLSAALDVSTDPMARFNRDQMRGTSGLTGHGAGINSGRLDKRTSGDQRVVVRGMIVNVKPEFNAGRVRLGLRLYPDELGRMIFAQYIAFRQSEIIREIKVTYDTLLKFQQ